MNSCVSSRISSSNIATSGLAPVTEQEEEPVQPDIMITDQQGEAIFTRQPDITEGGMEGVDVGDVATNAAIRHIEFRGEGLDQPLPGEYGPVNIAPPTETVEGMFLIVLIYACACLEVL